MGEALTTWNDEGRFAVPAAQVAALIALVADGTVSHQAGKKVYAELTTSGGDPRAVAEKLGLIQVRDEGALEAWVEHKI
jgi:aspartyl-tRNA(Asn)/glutamyl-tRNA(Gln) amidotransferase subunit B